MAQISFENVLDMDWGAEYDNFPKWSNAWKEINLAQQGGKAWPKGFQIAQNRLIFEGKWCVPDNLTGKILRAHHGQTGHAGGERLLKEALRFF